jgi:hypothetical protein
VVLKSFDTCLKGKTFRSSVGRARVVCALCFCLLKDSATMAITFTRKGRRKHRRRKGKTVRERSLVDYRKAPASSTKGATAAGDRSNERDRRRPNDGFSMCVVDPRRVLPPSEREGVEDENKVLFFLRKKKGESSGAAGCRTPISRRPSMKLACDGVSSEDESTTCRELRSLHRRDSMSLTSKCDSWASPSPSPCCVMSDFPARTPRRSVIRSISSDSLDSISSSLPDLPSFHANSLVDHRSSARFFTPRRARRRLSIPLKSFSDAGLNILLKMHEELRVATEHAEQERREKEKKAPKRSKSRQRKDEEIHKELTKKIKRKANRGSSKEPKSPETPSQAPSKSKLKKVISPKSVKAPPQCDSEAPPTPNRGSKDETLSVSVRSPAKASPAKASPKKSKSKSKQTEGADPKVPSPKKKTTKKTANDASSSSPVPNAWTLTFADAGSSSPCISLEPSEPLTYGARDAGEKKASDSTVSTVSCTSASAAEPKMSMARTKRRESNNVETKSHEKTASKALSPTAAETSVSETDAPVKTIQVPTLSSQSEERPQNAKSRKVKEMHKTLTKTVVLETFPRVTVTPRANIEESTTLTASTEQRRPSNALRMSGGQVTTVIQAIIEDREEERQEHRKEASRHRPSLKSARRLGSRVQKAIFSLGFQ